MARLLQPILTGLALHLGVTPATVEASVQGSAHGITLREMAILSLLSQGLTADGLAGRLGISPRTVGKHLEHFGLEAYTCVVTGIICDGHCPRRVRPDPWRAVACCNPDRGIGE